MFESQSKLFSTVSRWPAAKRVSATTGLVGAYKICLKVTNVIQTRAERPFLLLFFFSSIHYLWEGVANIFGYLAISACLPWLAGRASMVHAYTYKHSTNADGMAVLGKSLSIIYVCMAVTAYIDTRRIPIPANTISTQHTATVSRTHVTAY